MPLPTRPLHTVYVPGFDAYGARTSRRVYDHGSGFEVVTTRDFYTRDGGVYDYEITSERFSDLRLAEAAAGVVEERRAA